jgi:hypothetical protein
VGCAIVVASAVESERELAGYHIIGAKVAKEGRIRSEMIDRIYSYPVNPVHPVKMPSIFTGGGQRSSRLEGPDEKTFAKAQLARLYRSSADRRSRVSCATLGI